MAEIECTIDYTQDENDNGREVDCIIATCSQCGYETQSWGHGEASVKRCLALMREECPEGEENYYVEE